MITTLISRETQRKAKPSARFREGFNIKDHVALRREGKNTVAEFIGTGDFATQFFERQRYEVDAGRDMEPLLFADTIYDVMSDPNLPRTVPINVLGPAGVVFTLIQEGGELKFASVGESSKSVTLARYAAGISYGEDLFEFNELFRLSSLERQFGVAHNALLNHLHAYPILNASYGTRNTTDATSAGSFSGSAFPFMATDPLPLKYLRAFEQAIIDSKTDKTNPRPGPYALVVSSSDVFTAERALNRVDQQGYDMQSSAIGRIQTIIEYDGWTGVRGLKETSYSGVSAGKAYLVNVGYRGQDTHGLKHYEKRALTRRRQDGDKTRFIVEDVVWDTLFGVYADPTKEVQEITLPTTATGAS